MVKEKDVRTGRAYVAPLLKVIGFAEDSIRCSGEVDTETVADELAINVGDGFFTQGT